MKLFKLWISAVLAIGSTAQAESGHPSYAPIYNEYVKEHLSEIKILKSQKNFGDLLLSIKDKTAPETYKVLEAELSPVRGHKLPKIQISAFPWVKILIHDENQVHTLSFVGDNENFMSLNGEMISWKTARDHSLLSVRISDILNNKNVMTSSHSLLSLLFPRAHAYAAGPAVGESWAQRNKPLIYGTAIVASVGILGYLGYMAISKASKAKTEHRVIVSGVPEKIEGKLTLEGIPDQLKVDTNHDINVNAPTDFNLNTQNDVDFGIKGLTADKRLANVRLAELTGIRVRAAAVNPHSTQSSKTNNLRRTASAID